jgi:TPR repeat protein
MNNDTSVNTKEAESAIPEDILAEFSITPDWSDEKRERLQKLACDYDHVNKIAAPGLGEAAYQLACSTLKSEYLSWFENSAILGGYAPAMYAIARIIESGADGTDFLAAAYWYQQAEQNGMPNLEGRAERLYQSHRMLAESGDAAAMYDIGACYETGIFQFIPKSIDLAIKWYKKSAKLGYVPASYAMGEVLFFNKDGPENNKKKAVWYFESAFRQAMKLRSVPFFAENRLGQFGMLGEGNGLGFAIKLLFSKPLEYEPVLLPAVLSLESGQQDIIRNAQKEFFSIYVPDKEEDVRWEFEFVAALYKVQQGNVQEARKSFQNCIRTIFSEQIYEKDPMGAMGIGFSLSNVTFWRWPFPDFTSRRTEESKRCSNTEAMLRKLAQEGMAEAQLLLGMILIEHAKPDSPDHAEAKAWLVEASRNGYFPAAIYLAVGIYNKSIRGSLAEAKFALAGTIYSNPVEFMQDETRLGANEIEHYWKYKGDLDEDDFNQWRERTRHYLSLIEKEDTRVNEREQTQKDMLSYLTHTLNNTLSGGPEAARQAMRILGSELYENNQEYKAINNIASMFSTFLFAQQLLKTFKLYIAEPESLRQNWEADVDGDASMRMVLALTLRQTLSQVVFASNHQAALRRLLPHKESGAVKVIRKAFMDEIVPLDVDDVNAEQVFDWVREHLGIIHMSIDPAAELRFRSNSTRFTFFFSSFSELVYNALKYSDGAQPIEITWDQKNGDDVFRCANTWTNESVQGAEGSGKGLVFLARLVEMLGARFEKRIDGNRFVAEILFPNNLLKRAT